MNQHDADLVVSNGAPVITASDLTLAIMTIPGRPGYVQQTLASLFASDPLVHRLAGIHLMVGSSDSRYLDNLRHHHLIRIHALSENEASTIANWAVHRRFCHNYHRCLSVDIGSAKGLCILEDDVIVRDGFVTKLLATIHEMEVLHQLRQYVLALYVPYRLGDDPSLNRGRFYSSYYAPSFYGTQAVYYPATALRDMAALMHERGVIAAADAGDMIVKEYGTRINAIYGSIVSLVQHVGYESTGLGSFHASSTFHDPFPSLELAHSHV